MTYFGVLLTFVLPPLLILALWTSRDVWGWLLGKGPRPKWLPYQLILAHVVIALVYTTPWDNYLVATGVWWYNPALVTGLRLWYVPIEEYTFFVLQTLLTGLWTVWLLRRLPALPLHPATGLRLWSSAALGLGWLASAALWLSGWQPGIYLALILVWALLPLFIQFLFGADILFSERRALLPAVGLPTLYLWLVDALAIGSGTWTIDPQQTTGLMLGVLPIEEMIFFLSTNVILAFGIALMNSAYSHVRARGLVAAARKRLARGTRGYGQP